MRQNYELRSTDSYADIEADLSQFLNPNTGDGSDTTANTEFSVADYDSYLDIDSDEKGPKISESVATIINKLCLKRISLEQSKALVKKTQYP